MRGQMKRLGTWGGRPCAGAGYAGPTYSTLRDEASLAGLRTSIPASQRDLAERQFPHEADSAEMARPGLTNRKKLF